MHFLWNYMVKKQMIKYNEAKLEQEKFFDKLLFFSQFETLQRLYFNWLLFYKLHILALQSYVY